jgi:hypothetical protein
VRERRRTRRAPSSMTCDELQVSEKPERVNEPKAHLLVPLIAEEPRVNDGLLESVSVLDRDEAGRVRLEDDGGD